MSLKKPASDEAWADLLSACLDGELEGSERRALECWLAEEPRRARQLEELYRVSGLLQEWTVEAPEPGAEFVRRIENELRMADCGLRIDPMRNAECGMRNEDSGIKNSKCKMQNSKFHWLGLLLRPVRLPWPVAAALFFCGMLAGGSVLALYRGWGGGGVTATVAGDSPAKSAPPAPDAQEAAAKNESPISDTQAAALWHKVRLAGAMEPPAEGSGALPVREALIRKYRERAAQARRRDEASPAGETAGLRQMIEKYRKTGKGLAFHWAANGK